MKPDRPYANSSFQQDNPTSSLNQGQRFRARGAPKQDRLFEGGGQRPGAVESQRTKKQYLHPEVRNLPTSCRTPVLRLPVPR